MTVTPQPDAFMTMRLDRRPRLGTSSAPPGVDVARACARARRRGRSRCRRIAPQQPASCATSVWMPAASSTRAVAALMFGIIAGCTQPASISTLRACSVRGQRVRAGRRGAAGTLLRSAFGSRPRTRLAELHRRGEQRRGQAFLQRPAQRLLAGRPRHLARRRCGGRSRPGCRTARPTGRWSRSCGRSGSGRGGSASRASAPRLRAPASSGRCGRAGRRARRRGSGRSGRSRCRSRSARTCAGWPRLRRRRACP